MDSYFYGWIQLFPYHFAPVDWIPCDGRLLSISQYQPLYSLLGITFGGDGATTFAVPNLNQAAIGPYNKYYINNTGIYPPRQ